MTSPPPEWSDGTRGLILARCMKFDDQDKAALHALDDDFTISDDGEVAKLEGEMKVEIARPAYDSGSLLYLTITLPGGEEFAMTIRHDQLLEAAGIEEDEVA
jgi:hypothetical protein